jgi:hypothetical protein
MVTEDFDDAILIGYIQKHPRFTEELKDIAVTPNKDARTRLLKEFRQRIYDLQNPRVLDERSIAKPRNWKVHGMKALKVIALMIFILLGILQFLSQMITPAITDKYVIDAPQVYKAVQGNETTYISLVPPNRLLYSKEAYGLTDNAEFEVQGYLAPHVCGPIYYVTELGKSYYRYLPGAHQVAMIQLKLVATGGITKESTFDPIGTEYNDNLIFYDKKLNRRGIQYHELSSEDGEFIVNRAKLELLFNNYGKDL